MARKLTELALSRRDGEGIVLVSGNSAELQQVGEGERKERKNEIERLRQNSFYFLTL